jgi:alkanesulfonate monooxygenase SsuD/methylene tetrahydromethanopterin reductase-like flavin-dependent oxidoreductase (luciferase family)
MLRDHHLAAGVPALHETLARVAAGGIDHVGVFDHVSFWDGTGFDGLINATALAVAHPTLPVHTGVYLLPLRHPVTVARQLSSLALLAPGRIHFGVGIGGEDRHEVMVCGVAPRTRGLRMDECLSVLQDLLDGRRVTFDGEHVDVQDALILPTPKPRIPIYVGGRSNAALRRTARFGDGWVGFACSPDRFATGIKLVEQEAQATGRTDVAWRHGLVIWCGFGRSRAAARPALAQEIESLYQLPFERFVRYCPYGTAADVAESLADYVDAGCPSFSLISCAESLEEAIESTAEVRRLLRAA